MVTIEERNFDDCDYYTTHDNKIIPSFSMNQFIHESNERSKSLSLSTSNHSSKDELDEPTTIINGILPYYKKDEDHISIIYIMKRMRFNIFLLMTASFFAGYRFRCFVERK